MILNIIKGWHLYLNADLKTRLLIESRLKVCDPESGPPCAERKAFSAMGQLILGPITGQATAFKCAKCGCHLEAKAADPKQSCPLGKWRT